MAAGDRLRDALASLSRKLSRGATLRVGFLEGATYDDGTPVAAVAAIQEFGAPGARLGAIPPRPFFRTMIRENSGGWADTLSQLLVRNEYDLDRTMDAMGEVLRAQLKRSIADLDQPALSQVTLLLRQNYGLDGGVLAGKKGWPPRVGARAVIRAIHQVKSGAKSSLSGVAAKPLVRSGTLIGAIDFEVT